MSARISTRDDMVWSFVWWAIALAVAVVVFFLLSIFIKDDPAAGLIFAAVAFVLVGALLVRYGPGPGPSEEVWHDPDALPARTHTMPDPAAVAPVADPAVARAAEPVKPVAQVVAPAVAPVAPVAPVAGPITGAVEIVTPPPGTGISERVRDAARAAGEAARALSGEGGAAAGRKPETLAAPRDGAADDLKRLKGVGPKIEVVLHDVGIYHFDQIAGWGPDEIAWVDANLGFFNGRIEREDWIGQAKILAAGGETEHSKKVDRGEAT